MTEIKDLQAGKGSVNIEATVKSIEEPRIINKYGRDLKIANAIITDGTGEVKLTLWNEDVGKVKVGAIVKITNGYVSEFQGEKQLTSGKFGKLEVVGKNERNDKDESDEKKSDEEDKPELDENEEDISDDEEVEDY